MLVNAGRVLTCVALWVAWMAGVSAQQAMPRTTENPRLPEQLKEIEAEAAEKRQRTQEVLRQLPVDPDECALPVLVDLMEQSRHEKQARRYVSVFDNDIDAKLQRLLRQRGLEARPKSALVRETRGHDSHGPDPHHTNFWQFSVGAIERVGADEYILGAGYHCGSLCFGRLRYTLKVEGTGCSIVSKEWEGVS